MTAIPAQFLSLANGLIFSPLGLSFQDDFTKQPQVGYVIPTLLIETPPGSGTFVPTGIRGLFTKSGILAYPNLGRRGIAPRMKPRETTVSRSTPSFTSRSIPLRLRAPTLPPA